MAIAGFTSVMQGEAREEYSSYMKPTREHEEGDIDVVVSLSLNNEDHLI